MKVNYTDDGEKITISGDLGAYFITYNVGTSPCIAGRFETFFDALRALKKHRPKAHAVATLEW